jgi:Fur family peroxide stress response transcriptional regulator
LARTSRRERQSAGDGGPQGLERYAEDLRGRGVRATSQRIQIYALLDARDDHPDVDTIYRALRPGSPSLSRTTVYNTLEALRRKGLVQSITISGTEHRYEVTKPCHHHLLCVQCGRIYDIMIDCPFLGEMLHGEHKVDEVHGYFKGTCKACLSRGQDR